jgi:hypothetical protein
MSCPTDKESAIEQDFCCSSIDTICGYWSVVVNISSLLENFPSLTDTVAPMRLIVPLIVILFVIYLCL